MQPFHRPVGYCTYFRISCPSSSYPFFSVELRYVLQTTSLQIIQSQSLLTYLPSYLPIQPSPGKIPTASEKSPTPCRTNHPSKHLGYRQPDSALQDVWSHCFVSSNSIQLSRTFKAPFSMPCQLFFSGCLYLYHHLICYRGTNSLNTSYDDMRMRRNPSHMKTDSFPFPAAVRKACRGV